MQAARRLHYGSPRGRRGACTHSHARRAQAPTSRADSADSPRGARPLNRITVRLWRPTPRQRLSRRWWQGLLTNTDPSIRVTRVGMSPEAAGQIDSRSAFAAACRRVLTSASSFAARSMRSCCVSARSRIVLSWFAICSTARVRSANWPAITAVSSCFAIFGSPDLTLGSERRETGAGVASKTLARGQPRSVPGEKQSAVAAEENDDRRSIGGLFYRRIGCQAIES